MIGYLAALSLTVTMATSSGRSAAEVTVLSNANITFLENSFRESEPTGHYSIGAYKMYGLF